MREASAPRWHVLAPLDALRAGLYRALAPWLAPLYADRARRVAWMGAVSACTSFALVLAAPLWVLALGPVLLGVPHLVADLRYLVVKPGLHRRVAPASFAAACLLAVGFGAPAVVGLFAMVPAVFAARADVWKKALGLTVWLVLSVCAWRDEYAFLLAFLHGHNLLALALWWRLRRRDGRATWTVVLVLAGAAALLAGLGDGVITALGGFTAPGAGTDFTELVASMAPHAEPTLALHLVLSFAFLQSVHYALWLRLIPEDARERPAPRPFRASLHALREDFGTPFLLAAGAAALGIAVWGAFDLPGARLGYLRLATFHGYLELAAAAWLWLEGRPGGAQEPAR
ncbi:MAG: hypothetical protein AB1938_25425 [Myxococcota bacterium]